MLFEIFILIQTIAIGSFLLAWFSKNIIMWGITVILFGIQMITGFNIEFIIFNITDSGIVPILINHSSVIAYINMLFFSLGILMFFWDIFTQRT